MYVYVVRTYTTLVWIPSYVSKFQVLNQLADFCGTSYEYCPIVGKPKLVLFNFTR